MRWMTLGNCVGLMVSWQGIHVLTQAIYFAGTMKSTLKVLQQRRSHLDCSRGTRKESWPHPVEPKARRTWLLSCAMTLTQSTSAQAILILRHVVTSLNCEWPCIRAQTLSTARPFVAFSTLANASMLEAKFWIYNFFVGTYNIAGSQVLHFNISSALLTSLRSLATSFLGVGNELFNCRSRPFVIAGNELFSRRSQAFSCRQRAFSGR